MKAFVYVYILVSQANEAIHYTGITRDLEQRLLEHNGGTCPHTSEHGHGESKLQLHSNPRARRARSKNI
jgi:predicted GIY-YIG superfamily endonuclease